MKKETIKTSVSIDEEVLKKFKIHCIQKGKNISERIEELMKEDLKK